MRRANPLSLHRVFKKASPNGKVSLQQLHPSFSLTPNSCPPLGMSTLTMQDPPHPHRRPLGAFTTAGGVSSGVSPGLSGAPALGWGDAAKHRESSA